MTKRSVHLAALLFLGAGVAPVWADTPAITIVPPPAVSAPATPPAATVPPASAEEVKAWQDVISGQIAAMRKADGKTALSFAATTFQQRFTDPNSFLVAIAATGYTPIFTSLSETFGTYVQPDVTTVLQEVKLVGPDQTLFEAIYQLAKEPGGWRVQGVQLGKSTSVGV